MISVIFPTYNESGNAGELHRLNREVLSGLGEPYEIIVVDDGSTDGTLEILKKLRPVKIVSLAKRFGQAAALEAGIRVSKGDKVVIMDGDLQNDPRDIPRLLAKMKEGYDIVSGWRKNRFDSWFRQVHSSSANWLTRKISGLNLHDHACALKIYNKKFIENVTLHGAQHVFLAAQAYRRGAKITEIEVTHHARKSGLSKHHLWAGVKAIADLITVRFLAPDTRPFVFFGFWSLLFAGASFLLVIAFAVLFKFFLLLLAFWFFLIGVVFSVLGLMAELARRSYLEIRQEYPYMVREVIEQ